MRESRGRTHGSLRCANDKRRVSMNKNELIAAVSEKAELSKQDASSAVDAVFETLQATMAKGDDIRLVGFGTFSVSHRAASKGRNPSTGAEVDIPARNVPKFAAGKGLKDAVNNK
ncbi:HU family DNA-binding protein [Aurantimonas manganoxydans]|nr:HU family DNA-binding protein [Aurantimonas manganoxydans]